ncbi:putative short chain dehydrogenase protein [Echria macrotheca]|uniref:Short chain dehydrogenase protein n=1 Tax=Echria macrotheca TaxID=438768 RepID=A0AAJ0B6V3_9PEZI|nr:putative short chain dehydrogenase protein [Echria macrotheca]
MELSFTSLFAGLGILTAGIVAAATIDTILPFLRPSQLQRYLYSRNGKPAWALVTGASDGIGKAFSHELASKGFNVVLHGRNPAKLQKVKQELQTAFPQRDFRILIADATRCDPKIFEDIADQLADLHITLVVSNAGASTATGPGGTGSLESQTLQTVADGVNLNVVFPTMLVRTLLPLLPKDGPAFIVIVGSMADFGFPLLASYGASKSYLNVFAKALGREMRLTRPNIETIYLRLSSTTGVSHTWGPPSLFKPHSTTMAKAALARIGCGRPVIAPYWPHAILSVITELLPRGVQDDVFGKEMLKLQREGLNPEDKTKST